MKWSGHVSLAHNLLAPSVTTPREQARHVLFTSLKMGYLHNLQNSFWKITSGKIRVGKGSLLCIRHASSAIARWKWWHEISIWATIQKKLFHEMGEKMACIQSFKIFKLLYPYPYTYLVIWTHAECPGYLSRDARRRVSQKPDSKFHMHFRRSRWHFRAWLYKAWRRQATINGTT